MGNNNTVCSTAKSVQSLFGTHSSHTRSAVVLGATGATGQYILCYLLRSPQWQKVSIIHRREIDLRAISEKTKIALSEQQKSKLCQHVVEMEKMCENEEAIQKNAALFKDHDVTFCVLGAIGTSSADAFRTVDYGMVRDGGILSKHAGVPHFSLLTSQGSNHNLWANDWKLSRWLLILKIKGESEQNIIAKKFAKTSIFRPALLGRDGESGGVMNKLSVRDLASVMVYDAECDSVCDVSAQKNASQNEEEKTEEKTEDKIEDETVVIYEAKDINNALIVAQTNFNTMCNDCNPSSNGDEKENQ